MSSVAGNSIFTIILLALLGFVVGSLLTGAAKRQNKKGHAVPHEQNKQEPDEMTRRQLIQLKEQLRSGLITKEEYQAKKQKILDEL